MSSSTGHQPPLTYGSQNQQQQVYHHQPLVDSRTASSWSQTIIILLLTLLLFHILYPTKIMDLLDAYMELPSFADLPFILRDHLRGYGNRARRMSPLLVLRPFALENDILTWRDRDILSDRLSARSTSAIEGDERGMSLTERFNKRGWPGSTDKEDTKSMPLKVPGLINSGNFCFMNSVLQALASVPEFINYLEAINDGPETTPVSTTLLDLLTQLNTFSTSADALCPDKVARALMQSDKNRLLATREQQDAQEFFSLLIDTLEIESSKQWLLINKPAGLESITHINDGITIDTPKVVLPSPFEGLSANRLGCLKCKYVENIRHEKFSEMVLPLTKHRNTSLNECLEENFKMEILEDVECLKCTLLSYRSNLSRLVNSLSSVPEKSAHLESVLSDARKRLDLIDNALKSGKIEDPKLLSPGSSTEKEIKKFIQRSPKTKAHMIARPPSILAFHIQRSSFHPFTGRAMKNQASVSFPDDLDLSRYVTTHELSMDPEEPISVWKEGDPKTEYRLRSVIVHYGLHNMGHYVAYRLTEEGWFRISDEDVEKSSREEVLREGARGVFMLMYEKVQTHEEEDGELVEIESESEETVTEGTTEPSPMPPMRDEKEKHHDYVDVEVEGGLPKFKRISFDQLGRPFELTVTG